MELIRILLSRLATLFHLQKLDQDLDEALRAHIEFAVEETWDVACPPRKHVERPCESSAA